MSYISKQDHNKIRELINRIPPYANWYVQQIVGFYIDEQLGQDGFSIYDAWYSQACNYPGDEQSYCEYLEFGFKEHKTGEDLILKLANNNSTGELPFEVSISFNPFRTAA